MKPNELTREMFAKRVKEILVREYKYTASDAEILMRRFSKEMDDEYESLTSEDRFVETHPNDSESLGFFRNGNYIESGISSMAWSLDLMA